MDLRFRFLLICNFRSTPQKYLKIYKLSCLKRNNFLTKKVHVCCIHFQGRRLGLLVGGRPPPRKSWNGVPAHFTFFMLCLLVKDTDQRLPFSEKDDTRMGLPLYNTLINHCSSEFEVHIAIVTGAFASSSISS